MPADSSLDAVITQLQRHARGGSQTPVSEDLQVQAVRRFWESQRFDNLKDARLVSFGLCIPSGASSPCIMEDRLRFQAVLDRQTGVDQWVDEPRWYRRCYQGLVRSYFTYDPNVERHSTVGRKNWGDLRDYLHDRTRNIVDKTLNPDWVTTAVGNRQLFGEDPCAPYAAEVLKGNTEVIDELCEQLGVIKASWFLRELVLAQVRQATLLSQDKFKELIPDLVKLIANNTVLRDRGLILMLDKHASVAQPALNESLRNASVEWWGNPWLPSNETRWGGVVPAAREMVSVWLKSEFIEAFFTKLAEDGVGDRRRANFWLRYVKSMDTVQFALGAQALYSGDRDFKALRTKMKGLYTELKTTDSSNNAFVMTMGDLVAVEFGGMGHALYGYDQSKVLPFDMAHPVVTTVDAKNSLKHKQRMLWMSHQDGIKGWNKWEEMFEATLKQEFGIKPNVEPRRVARSQTPSAAKDATAPSSSQIVRPTVPPLRVMQPEVPKAGPVPISKGAKKAFSMEALDEFARARSLKIEDFSKEDKGGNLWVRTDDGDLSVNRILLDWQFRYRAPKGWWR
ncbi:EH signature domain-containing protein [Paucibacter sp. B2R-40]|nr:EH signature domain-containing protein [Paucibacter sp. B2R-40]